jgi:type I restriction enzyme S subunit
MLLKILPKEGIDIPEIRFSGFTDSWEKLKFNMTFTSLVNNTLSRAALNNKYGTIKNIHYGDVLIKFGECLNVKNEELPFITDSDNSDKFVFSKLQDGDIIIADTAEDETAGKCTEIQNIGDQIVVSGLHTIPSRPMFSFASGYLGYYMNSKSYHSKLLRLMQGTKVTSISKTALQDTVISYPKNTDEQYQISMLFHRLDTLITLHRRKLGKLKNIKKSMLNKMFVSEV